MKRILFLTVAMAFLMASSIASAQDVPELRGTWVGETQYIEDGQFKSGKIAYVIDKQLGAMFSGHKLWFSKRNVLLTENFVGLWDQGRMIFADKKGGRAFGYRLSKQELKINSLDGPKQHALVARLERVRFTTGFVDIDKDGNDYIVQSEITNHYPLNAKRIMMEADINGDGRVTKREWEQWKKKNDW